MERRRICRYFQRGSCKKQKCPFVHLHESKKNCEFYLKGFCRKGNNCNFYHPPKETNEEKEVRKNFKQAIKKQKPKQHDYQEHEREQQQEEQYEHEEQGLIKEQENEHQHEQLIIENQQKQIKDKQKRIAMILGLSSSQQQQSEEEEQTIQQPIKKVRYLNFNKIYPKKFPDYSKSIENKQKIQQNQQKYFKGKKFVEFINCLHDDAQKQYYQIIKKFQESFRLEAEVQDTQNKEYDPKLYRINLRPLLYSPEIHLHFQMIEDNIQLQIDCRKYPEQRAKFQIKNFSIPEQYKQKLIASLNKIHQKKSIFETLKTFMNNFQKIYNLAKSKLEDQYFSQIELEKNFEKKMSNFEKKEATEKKRKMRKNKKEEALENPDVVVQHFAPTQKIIVGNMNYDILVQSLYLQNCDYAIVDRILLYIQCICQKQIMHILQADRKQMKIGVKLKCKKCSIIIGIALHREVMQVRSTLVGKLGIDNGRLLEVGGICWKIGCPCNQQIEKNKIYLSGKRLNINCHQCFKHLQVHYMGLKFHNPFLPYNITEQTQLPKKGACKHVKLSFRWVRYGCCGRMFSCDECHSKGSVFQHEKIEGTTMLCGFCSVEGPYGKQCQHCKRQLVKGVDKSGHWQGGMGCREQTLLSKKDAKKYTGLTKKK